MEIQISIENPQKALALLEFLKSFEMIDKFKILENSFSTKVNTKNEPSFFSNLYAFFFYFHCPKCITQSGVSQGSKEETIGVYRDDKSNKNVRIYSNTEFIKCRRCNHCWVKKTEHRTHQGC